MDSLTIANVVLGICRAQAGIQLETGTPQSMVLAAREMKFTADQLFGFAEEERLEGEPEVADKVADISHQIVDLCDALHERVDEITQEMEEYHASLDDEAG